MSLRTKLNPMGGKKSGGNYKAYIVTRSGNSYTYYDVANYGFSANIDPETTFATNDGISTEGSNYISLNGKLVTAGSTSSYSSPILDNCTMISGTHCISNNKLYSLSSTTATLVNVSGNCTKITGCYLRGNQGYIIAIIDGYIYYADSSSASTFYMASGLGNGWTDISGYPMPSSPPQRFLGIKNNTAYQIAANGETYYSRSGYYINNAEKIYGISAFSSASSPTYYGVVKTTSGVWYRLGGSHSSQIYLPSGKTIEKISVNGCPANTPASTDYNLAITNDGYLYQLPNMSRVGTYSQLEYISGCYGIMNGKLYWVGSQYNLYPVSVITDKCIKVCTMSLGNSARALVICEK